ncbi:MAG TPA: pyridoxal phosphate-dependent aminotransferase [Marinagarivorans sp.]
MKLSSYGQQMAGPSPIAELMQDLGDALNNNPDVLFLGGGNPALIPAASEIFRNHLQALLAEQASAERWLGVYQSPQGYEPLLTALSGYLQEQGWPVSEQNLMVLNGGQSAFYRLFNAFGGPVYDPAGCVKNVRQIHLPVVPEYVGYRGQMIGGDAFVVSRPLIVEQGENRFRYTLDRNAVQLTPDSGALCLSRPANPSANVLDLDDLTWLAEQAKAWEIPMIVDCAYGSPIPNIMPPSQCHRWAPGTIAVISASKLGLPGLRTAVVVADASVVALLTRIGAIESLAAGNTGPMLLERLITSGDIARLTELVPAFYQQKRQLMLALLDEHLAGTPYKIHIPDGAFFVWLWLPDLPIGAKTLYQRLKVKGVLVMAGDDFFFGEEDRWQHAKQCLRLNICQSDGDMAKAVAIIAGEVKSAYVRV